jgi:hypothetical protein
MLREPAAYRANFQPVVSCYIYLFIYLIKFNVRIEPLGYGRLIIHGFASLGASSRSTFVLALHGRQL